jgi:hypothetical protein
MKTRWKILIAVAVFLAVFTGIWLVTMHVQPENEVEAYKKTLREKGEKLEISEVLPPPVPAESNGVAVVQSAFALFSPLSDEWTNLPSAMRMVAPGKAMIGWAQPDVRGYDFTNSWENIMAAAEANRPATEMLRQAMDYPAIDFQLDYNKGFEMLLPHLAPLKRSAQRLSAAAMCDLHNGDTASATTNLCALLALVQGERDERTIISQLVRIAMAAIAASANWELLQSTNLTNAELATLQMSWEQLEFVNGAEGSILMERATTVTTIKKMRASKSDFDHLMGMMVSSGASGLGGSGSWLEDIGDMAKSSWEKTKLAGATFMWRTSWGYSDELQALEGDQLILETLRTVKTNQFFQPAYTNMLNGLSAMGVTNDESWVIKLDIPDFRRIFSDDIGALSATVRKTMAAEASRRIVITAIALKRFQLKHGNYPEKLSELAPEFLAAIPLDAVDGQPLRYRRNADGTFLLYSVGENGKDDGGDPSLEKGVTSSSFYWQNPHALDWVWPQPATAEEVQSFYNHPPK